MTRRSGRGHIKVKQVLEKLETGRAGATQVHREAKIGSREYDLATYAVEAIDELADRLSGEERCLHARPASTPGAKRNR